MRVSITQADIDKGGRGAPRNCALASALKRQLGEDVGVTGIGDKYGLVVIGMTPTWNLSRRATRWAKRFDSGLPVNPATFVLHAI